jgi:DNA-binding CsgD family transcriptional regulator
VTQLLYDPFSHLNNPAFGQGERAVIDHVDLLLCLAEGMEQTEIAEKYGLAITTIQKRLRHMRDEWGVRNATQLVAEAYHRGVIKSRNCT